VLRAASCGVLLHLSITLIILRFARVSGIASSDLADRVIDDEALRRSAAYGLH